MFFSESITTDENIIDETSPVFEDEIKRLAGIENELNTVKNTQTIFDGSDWTRESVKYEFVNSLKLIVKRATGESNITVAWLKFYEIIIETNLITSVFPLLDKLEDLRIFLNGELPGAGILAAWYYCTSQLGFKPQWKASSLMPSAANEALPDRYGIYANNRDNWVMDSKHNGDMTDLAQQDTWKRDLGEWAHVYMCDAAGPPLVPAKQEVQHIPILAGAVLAALNTLVAGGNMFVKLYTIFSPHTIAIIAATSSCFERAYIYKPMTSKEDNSEVYLVGISYCGHKKPKAVAAIEHMRYILATPENERMPKIKCSRATLLSITGTQDALSKRQAAKIKVNVDAFSAMRSGDSTLGAQIIDSNQKIIDAWRSIIPLQPQYAPVKLPQSYQQAAQFRVKARSHNKH